MIEIFLELLVIKVTIRADQKHVIDPGRARYENESIFRGEWLEMS